jgi:hypothetical protein
MTRVNPYAKWLSSMIYQYNLALSSRILKTAEKEQGTESRGLVISQGTRNKVFLGQEHSITKLKKNIKPGQQFFFQLPVKCRK